MVLLSSPVVGLRPQGQVDFFAKSPTKDAKGGATLDAASVTDVARPHRGGGYAAPGSERAAAPAAELPAKAMLRQKDEDGTQEPCLVRSPSDSKLVDVTTSFPFGTRFTFWLRRGFLQNGKPQDPEALGVCSEVVDFWKYWNSIVLERLPPTSLLAIFRNPERPRAGPRAPGGKWVICPPAKEAATLFEELTLALVGGEFDETHAGAPCGVAFSKAENQIEVWNRCGKAESTELVLAQLIELVGKEVSIEYRPHRAPPGKDEASPTAAGSPKGA